VQKLFRFTDSVVFSFDGDAAGRRAAGRALEASLPHANDTRTVRFLFLPTEHDPDSYVREHGTEAFEQCVAQAVPLSRQLIEAARDGMDLDTAEGRAKLLANAKPLWAALPDGALKLQLLAELAQSGGLATADLAQLWQTAATPRRAAPEAAPPDAQPDTYRTQKAPRPNRMSNRAAPASPADTALRMLLLHSDWWQQLDADDHELLAGLPPLHGPLCAWLERYLHEHGPTPWAVLEQGLADTEWADAAPRLVPQSVLADEMQFADLRRVVDGMWIKSLQTQQEALIQQVASDPQALTRWRELEARRKHLLSQSRQPTLT
jgi:DNA primase